MKARHDVRLLATPLEGVYLTVSASSQRFDRHWHDCYGFGLLDRGGQRWLSRCGSVEAYSGTLINTNPGEVHDGQPLGHETRAWRILSVPVPVMAQALERDAGALEIAPPVIEDRELITVLRTLLRQLHGWHSHHASSEALAFEESLVATCTLLMSRHGAHPFHEKDGEGSLAAVRERLADVGSAAPSLGDLARIAGASKYQLLRAFTKRYGLPPHAWLLSLRAERARSLIQGGASLATAAARSGFADQSHMTRTFRRYYGYTPGAWQRQPLAGFSRCGSAPVPNC